MLEKLHKSSKTRRKGEKLLSDCDIQEPELEIEMLFRKNKQTNTFLTGICIRDN